MGFNEEVQSDETLRDQNTEQMTAQMDQATETAKAKVQQAGNLAKKHGGNYIKKKLGINSDAAKNKAVGVARKAGRRLSQSAGKVAKQAGKKVASVMGKFAAKVGATALKLLAPFALYILGAIVVVGLVAAAASIITDEEFSRTNTANYQHVDYTDGNTLMKNHINAAGNVFFNKETKRYELAKGEAPTEANKLYYVYYAIMANQSRWFVEYERTDTKPGDPDAGTRKNPYFKPIKRKADYTKYTIDGYMFNNNVMDKVGLRPVSAGKSVKLEDLVDESSADSVKQLSMNVNLLYLLNSTLNGELLGTGKSQMFFTEQFVKPVYHDEQYNFKPLTTYRDMTASEKTKYASVAHGDDKDSILEQKFQEKYSLWGETLDAQNEARGGSNASSNTGGGGSSNSATADGISNPILKKAVEWGLSQLGKGITYSMAGARDGSDGTMDCSGFVMTALKNAGMETGGWPLSTVGMLQQSNALGQSGTMFKEVDYKTAKKGTIIVVGGLGGGGAAGHTFFLLEDFHGDDTKVLECTGAVNGLYSENKFIYASMNYNQVVALEPTGNSSGGSSSSSGGSNSSKSKDKKASNNLSERMDNEYKDKITTGVLEARSRQFDTSYLPDLIKKVYRQDTVNYPQYKENDYAVNRNAASHFASDFSLSKLGESIGAVKQSDNGDLQLKNGKVTRHKPAVNVLGKYSKDKEDLMKWAINKGYNPAWVVAVISTLSENGAVKFDGSEYNFTNDPEVIKAGEAGNKEKPSEVGGNSGGNTSSSQVKTLDQFKQEGRVKWEGKEYTYYSIQEFPAQQVASGEIPGKWFDKGFMKDKDGYLILASDKPFGTVIDTPFGAKGKVYDRGVTGEHYDVFIDETGASSGSASSSSSSSNTDGGDSAAESNEGTGRGIQNKQYGARYYNLDKKFDNMTGGLEFLIEKLSKDNEDLEWSEKTAKNLGMTKKQFKAANQLYSKIGGVGAPHIKAANGELKQDGDEPLVFTYDGDGREDKYALGVISVDGKNEDTEILGLKKYYAKTEYVELGSAVSGNKSQGKYAIERDGSGEPKYTTGVWDHGFGSIFKMSRMVYYAYEVGIDKEGNYYIEKDNAGNIFQQFFGGGDIAEDTQYQILGATTPFGSLDMSNEIAESQYEIEQVIEKIKRGETLSGDDVSILNEHKESGTSIKVGDQVKTVSPGNFIVTTKPVLKEEPVLSDSNGAQYLLDYVQNYQTYVPSSVKTGLDVVNRWRSMNDINEDTQTVLNKIRDIFNDQLDADSKKSSSASGDDDYDASRFSGKTYKGTGSYKGDIPVSNSGNADQDKFLNKISEGAMDGWVKYGILPSVTIAQGIIESGWGKSGLTVQQNNLYGIKGSGDAGTGNWATGEDDANGNSYTINANFAAYSSWAASTDAHGRLLSGNTGMANYLKAVKEKDAQKAIQAIKDGGYATDTEYVSTIMGVINSNGLLEYDKYAIEYTDKHGFEATASGRVSNNPQTGSNSGGGGSKSDSGLVSVWGDGSSFWDGVVSFFETIQDTFLSLFNSGEAYDPSMFSTEQIRNEETLYEVKNGKVTKTHEPGSLIINGSDAYQWDAYSNKLSNENANMLLRQFVASIETRDNRPVYYDEVYDTFGNYDLSRILEENFKQNVEGLFKKKAPEKGSNSSSLTPEISGELFAGQKVADSTVTRMFGWYKDGDTVKFSPGMLFKGKGNTDVKALKTGKVVYVGDSEFGKTVIIRTDSDTEQIAYAGLGQISVKVDDSVSKDTPIGKSDKGGEIHVIGIRGNANVSKGLPKVPTTPEELEKTDYFDMASQFGITGDKYTEMQTKVNGYDTNKAGGKKPSAGDIKPGKPVKLGDYITTNAEFILPIKLEANQQATVSSPFGPRSFDGFHYGVDYVTGSNASRIIAAADGEVVFSGIEPWGAECIIIKHSDSLYSSYVHMASGTRTVKVGDRVKQGQELGTIGMTGNATGVHLHFEVGTGFNGWMSGQVNPLTYIK